MRRKKLEFSKVLVALISLNYLATSVVALIATLAGGDGLSDLLTFAGAPFASVTALYLVKAGAENREKIKRTSAQNYSDDLEEPTCT